jgi:hypothetical protein
MTEVTYGKSHVLTLPSGVKVRARRPSLLSLIYSGGFPTELTATVWQLYAKQINAEEVAQKEPEGLLRLAGLIEQYIPHVLISPRVGPMTKLDEGPEGVLTGTVALLDILDLDKQYLFLFGQRLILAPEERQAGAEQTAAADLAEFRQRAESGDAGSSGAAVQPATVAGAGDGS